MSASKPVPAVGAIVCPVGSGVLYRVVSANAHGCYVEAVTDEIVDVPGRQPRKLRYDEKRASLACSSVDGTLFDDRWRAWKRLG